MPRDEATRAAAEDAILETAAYAMQKARELGRVDTDTQSQLEAIFREPSKIQARSLLLDAFRHLHAPNGSSPELRVLACLRALERTHPDRHERLAELWEEIMTIATTEFHEEQECAA